MRDIRKVAVIGSGVMGGGIAAQIANAGVPVLLFDVTRDIATSAVQRLLKTSPAPFMSPSNARHITPLGIDSDLAQLADCDWIIEAIVERLDAKRSLYAKLASHARADAAISSNTSTIQLSELTAGNGEGFRKRFLITHFFNPPRYMRLLEIVRGEAASGLADAVAEFAGHRLGKTIVWCHDRPGFIANRLGCFWSQAAMATTFEMGLTVEEADAVLGRPFGIPKTGVFSLMDLVGIDLIPHVNASLAAALAPQDLFQSVNVPLPFVERMIAAGLTGRKAKGGFFRINREKGKTREAINFASGSYRPEQTVVIDETQPLLDQDNKLGRFARRLWALVFSYAGQLVGDAADDIASIDAAMRLGYNWRWGPFELMDRIGLAKVRDLIVGEGLPLAPIMAGETFYRDGKARGLSGSYEAVPRAQGLLLIADVKTKGPPLRSNGSANLWDLGDGVCAFELVTKMNTIDTAALEFLGQSLDHAEKHFRAMVIASDGPHTSAGINLGHVASAIREENWKAVENVVTLGQQAFKRLKYARIPVVGCAHGLALGGGCELLLHCAAIQAHAELRIGLVECSVGLIPGWGGNGEFMLRAPVAAQGPMPKVLKAFETIATALTSSAAAHAAGLGFLRSSDGITMNRDRLIADAKARALVLSDDYRPPEPPAFALPGPSGAVALRLQAEGQKRLGAASDYDLVVAAALAVTLSGGLASGNIPLTEQQLLDIERQQFMTIVRRPETLARIEHTLATGKPLRN